MNNIVRLTPDTPATTIGECDVTTSRLASFLEAAVIDFSIDDDGDLYASDGLEFPAWIRVLSSKKLIMFFTYIEPDNDKDEGESEDWVARVNRMNTSIIAAQFHWHEKAVWGRFWLSYDGGLNVRQFIKLLRRFGGAFKAGIMLGHDDANVDVAGA